MHGVVSRFRHHQKSCSQNEKKCFFLLRIALSILEHFIETFSLVCVTLIVLGVTVTALADSDAEISGAISLDGRRE